MSRNRNFSFRDPKEERANISESPIEEVANLFSKVNSEINKFDSIIEEVINKKEAVFLSAYRKQMAQIRQDLNQLKNSESAIEHQRVNSQLRNTITMLKGEVMEIFIKLEEKSKELDQTRIRLEYQIKANKYLQHQMKRLMKHLKTSQPPCFPTEPVQRQEHKEKQQVKSLFKTVRQSFSKLSSRKPKSTDLEGSIHQIVKNSSLAKQVVSVVNEWIKEQRRSLTNSKRLWQKRYTNKDLSERNSLESFFFECISATKKKLMKANPAKFLGQPDKMDLGIFKDQDKQSILGLFLCDKQNINKLYQSVFGNKFRQMRAKSFQK